MDAIAWWDGGAVTAVEVRQEAQRLPVALRDQFLTENGQRELLHSVVSKRLLAQEARRRGLDRSEDVRRQVQELEERLAVQALLAANERALPQVTDDELKAYFEQHQAEFRQPTKVRIGRVLVHGSDAKAKARIAALRARLLKREPLDKVAAAGDGPEKDVGGVVGWVTEATDDETRAALALSKVGEVSPVVAKDGALSVLTCLERVEAKDATLAEVRGQVEGRLGPVRQRKAFDALVSQLKAQAQVSFKP